MSSYYLCETCAVKHIGGETQSFIPFFSCSAKPTSMAGMIQITDGEIPKEVCTYYKPKVMKESWENERVRQEHPDHRGYMEEAHRTAGGRL